MQDPALAFILEEALALLDAGAAGLFQSPPSRPPLALLVAVAGPPLVFAVVEVGLAAPFLTALSVAL